MDVSAQGYIFRDVGPRNLELMMIDLHSSHYARGWRQLGHRYTGDTWPFRNAPARDYSSVVSNLI